MLNTHEAPNHDTTLVAKVENYLSEEIAEEWKTAFPAFTEVSNANRTLVPYDENTTTLTKAFNTLCEGLGEARERLPLG